MRSINVFLAASLSLAAAVPLATTAFAKVERPFPHISVTGEASINVAPDIAHATAGVNSEAKTPREAADANTVAMNAVIAALKQAGIADGDTRTSRFSIAPVYSQRQREGQSQLTGYRVSNQVRVTVRDVAKVGEVLDRLIGAGATNIAGVEFAASDPAKLLDEARMTAFADAKRKAELFARAAGAQIGRAVSVSEDDGRSPRRFSRSFPLAEASAASAPVLPGEETLRVHISVSFELNH
jgi:uncharacterized protein YggE